MFPWYFVVIFDVCSLNLNKNWYVNCWFWGLGCFGFLGFPYESKGFVGTSPFAPTNGEKLAVVHSAEVFELQWELQLQVDFYGRGVLRAEKKPGGLQPIPVRIHGTKRYIYLHESHKNQRNNCIGYKYTNRPHGSVLGCHSRAGTRQDWGWSNLIDAKTHMVIWCRDVNPCNSAFCWGWLVFLNGPCPGFVGWSFMDLIPWQLTVIFVFCGEYFWNSFQTTYGFKYVFLFTPNLGEHDPMWRAYFFQMGWTVEPTN